MMHHALIWTLMAGLSALSYIGCTEMSEPAPPDVHASHDDASTPDGGFRVEERIVTVTLCPPECEGPNQTCDEQSACVCKPGFADCNGVPEDGCEAALEPGAVCFLE